jgi:hypothetical protein
VRFRDVLTLNVNVLSKPHFQAFEFKIPLGYLSHPPPPKAPCCGLKLFVLFTYWPPPAGELCRPSLLDASKHAGPQVTQHLFKFCQHTAGKCDIVMMNNELVRIGNETPLT